MFLSAFYFMDMKEVIAICLPDTRDVSYLRQSIKEGLSTFCGRQPLNIFRSSFLNTFSHLQVNHSCVELTRISI